jgi:hypothetical protein
VKTASKAIAVQMVHSSRKGSRDIEHIGSAHRPEDVEVLEAVAALTREKPPTDRPVQERGGRNHVLGIDLIGLADRSR